MSKRDKKFRFKIKLTKILRKEIERIDKLFKEEHSWPTRQPQYAQKLYSKIVRAIRKDDGRQARYNQHQCNRSSRGRRCRCGNCERSRQLSYLKEQDRMNVDELTSGEENE